jgi:hypothetical protein
VLGQRPDAPGNEMLMDILIEDLPGHCECGSWIAFGLKRDPMLIEAREKERRLLSVAMTKQIRNSRSEVEVHIGEFDNLDFGARQDQQHQEMQWRWR